MDLTAALDRNLKLNKEGFAPSLNGINSNIIDFDNADTANDNNSNIKAMQDAISDKVKDTSDLMTNSQESNNSNSEAQPAQSNSTKGSAGSSNDNSNCKQEDRFKDIEERLTNAESTIAELYDDKTHNNSNGCKDCIFEPKINEIANTINTSLSEIKDEFTKDINSFMSNYIATNYSQVKRTIDLTVKSTNNAVNVNSSELTDNQNRLLANIVADVPAFLIGPAGCGKSYDVEFIANKLKLGDPVQYRSESAGGMFTENPQYFYPINAVQQEFQLKGYMDAKGFYQPTNFYKAFKFGGVFLIDELDASAPEALILLNFAIANKKFEFPDGNGTCTAHKDFRVVATGNTAGTGADIFYTGRNQLDAASLNRFVNIKYDYNEDIELALCNNDTELVDFAHDVRKIFVENTINKIFSYRQIEYIYRLKEQNLIDLKNILQITVLNGLDDDNINLIVNNINKSNKYGEILCS